MLSDLVAQINADAIRHNFRALRAAAPGAKLCPALKADAYGHGVRIVAPILMECGADYAAVATLPEAIELRDIGWKPPILVLGNILAVANTAHRRERLGAVCEYRLTLTIADRDSIRQVCELRPREPVGVHLKVDTGMGRMGVMPEQLGDLYAGLMSEPSIQLRGVYSHFATADFEQPQLVQSQLSAFRQCLASLKLPANVLRHLANSAATITLPDAHFDMVRPGLALYGYYPAPHMADQIQLRPILRLASHLTMVKKLPVGHCVGYGQTFVTKRETKLGIIPAGYRDGFVRLLSNNAVVGTPAGDAPVIGRVSMDQLAVDLTDLPDMFPGTQVTLIDDDNARPNSVHAIARRIGTIPYEVTCLLGNRIERRIDNPTGSQGP